MSRGQEQTCHACNGAGMTDKERHTVELNEKGEQVPVTRTFISACSHCSGTGKVSG